MRASGPAQTSARPHQGPSDRSGCQFIPRKPESIFCDRGEAKSLSFLNAKPCLCVSLAPDPRYFGLLFREKILFPIAVIICRFVGPFFRSPAIPSSIVRSPIVFEMCQILTIPHASYLTILGFAGLFPLFFGFRCSLIFLPPRPPRLDPEYCLRRSEYCSSARGEHRAPCMRY